MPKVDTLEHRVTVEGESGLVQHHILWKDKTPQEVCREQYPTHYLKPDAPPMRSTRPGVVYPTTYQVRQPGDEESVVGREVFTELIELPK